MLPVAAAAPTRIEAVTSSFLHDAGAASFTTHRSSSGEVPRGIGALAHQPSSLSGQTSRTTSSIKVLLLTLKGRAHVPTPATARSAQFLKSLKQFLDFRIISSPKALYCSDSGWLLGHLRGQFWQDGREQGWDILCRTARTA